MAARYLYLENAVVIDGSGADPLERGAILVEGDRIAGVGTVDSLRPPAHEEVVVVDATGKTVMPGMIDCHFHCAYHSVTCWEDYDLRRPLEHTTILAARNAQTLLEVGFTSARDVGSRGLVAVAVRDMINAGILIGPRMMAGSRIISSTGGLADGYGDWVDNRASLGQVVDGPSEVIKAVRQQVKYGVDNIKIEASGTGISPYSASAKQTLTTEEMAAAVREAHRNGVRVACHAQATEGIKNAVRAGVDTIEHGSFLDEEGAELMSRAGTFLVPTISVFHLYVHRGPEVGVPQWVVDKFRGDLDAHMESVKLALDRGIPMATGSDSGHSFNPQSMIAVELELMVSAGFTPMQALQAATSVAARAAGMADRVGRLQPGMYADMLVVDGDPLAEIGILRQPERLERVYKGGLLLAGRLAPRREELEVGFELAPAQKARLEPSGAPERPCC
ncbi:MAG TPA: amidohydrolase family protein [Candidatus Dormibacteraeota bacterium]|nr:amidohydrolase family protein [Candidatus Dormibacteraeota bacterium]